MTVLHWLGEWHAVSLVSTPWPLRRRQPPPLFSEVLSQDNSLFLPLSCIIVYELLISCFYFFIPPLARGPFLGKWEFRTAKFH